MKGLQVAPAELEGLIDASRGGRRGVVERESENSR